MEEYFSLSSQHGLADYPTSAFLIENMLISTNGEARTLYVVKDHKLNPEVMDYRKAFVRHWPNTNWEPVAKSELIDLQQRNDVYTSKEEHSDLQSDIVHTFEVAAKRRASDIHIRVGSKYTKIFFRIDGKLVFYNDLVDDKGTRFVQALYQTMCEGRTQPTFTFKEPVDAKVKESHVENLGLNGGRLATRPTDEKGLIVIRLLRKSSKTLTLKELGVTGEQEKILQRVITKPTGVVFMSGPTNSGKSTLAKCMAEIVTSRDPGIHMLTVEDPIESTIAGAVQTPLICNDRGTPGALSKAWGDAIANLMRLDPDQVYIGEVRDFTSATGAISAAQTGHKVYTTIHTNNPIDIIPRLKSFNVDMDLITDSSLVTCLIGQRLAPLLCESCKQPYSISKTNIDNVYRDLIEAHCDTDKVYLCNQSGCEHCNNTGYKGMTGIYEIIETNANFMQVFQNKGKVAAYEYWYQQGGQTLSSNALRLINDGRIDPVYSHSNVSSLDRDIQMFTDEIRNSVKSKLKVA
ncbi:Flp pilus assembly complex ATPase component TadA [Salmonella enterica]|nr:pilus assembly protein PilQ [Salmonella enterica]EEP3373120.1 Flp pilus assembly complex ATPase component [Salmonella enterica]EFP6579680.1 Flp pilus assembly complex ATPase component [Salmonella enterica]EGC7971447.1 Flp pilus assembly complex ATPase component [Salmonella enterica]EIV4461672.1 Flp pilus assembly complex ATPase component TadA [Salmonella enterica]